MWPETQMKRHERVALQDELDVVGVRVIGLAHSLKLDER